MIAAFINETPLSHKKAVAFVFIAAILWSTNGLFIKMINLGPLTIVGVRSAIAAIMMIALYNRKLRFNWSFPQIAGAVAYAATLILYVTATKMTTAANVVFLHYTSPVFTALLAAWLLKEKVLRHDWVVMFFVLCGMGLFFFGHFIPGGMWGNILAIISAITYALMNIFLRFQKHGSTLETIIIGNIIAALICSAAVINEPPTAIDWLPLLYMGTLQIGLSFILYCSAIRYLAALEAVLISTIDPLLNPIWVYLVVGEQPGTLAIIGGFIVISAVTLRNIFFTRKSSGEKSPITPGKGV